MSASIEDVARAAGVSVATVSRALRGLPNVAPSTRERVKLAAADLHYVADPHASRLAARRSATIGLVLPLLGGWYHARLFSGVEATLDAAGYDVLPYTVSGLQARERFVANLPFRKRVDGLIIADTTFDEPAWVRVTDAANHVVTIGCAHAAEVKLTIDNHGASRIAVEHLLSLGHRRIGLIGGLSDDPFAFSAPRERQAGYLAALAAWGVEPDPTLVVPGNFSLSGGAEGMSRLLSLADPPTAVFALSDEMAIGALQVARDTGLDVPSDLSVVGFDDHDVSEYIGLTTVRQQVVEQGEVAARAMLALVEAGNTVVDHHRMPTRLVVRGTTSRPPDSDRRTT